jgi:hypothetical protein
MIVLVKNDLKAIIAPEHTSPFSLNGTCITAYPLIARSSRFCPEHPPHVKKGGLIADKGS